MRAGDDDEMMHACCANPNLLHSWPSASQLGRIESPLDDDQSQSKRSISMVAAAAHVHLLSRGQSLKLQSGSMCSFTFHPPTIHPSALHYWWWRSRFPPSTTSHLVCHIEASHATVSYLPTKLTKFFIKSRNPFWFVEDSCSWFQQTIPNEGEPSGYVLLTSNAGALSIWFKWRG